MRDGIVLAVVFVLALRAISHPYIGALAWTWVSVMNPHRLGWSFAVDFPVGVTIVVGTLIGLVFTRDQRRLPLTAPVIVLFLFILWMCVTTVTAIYPDDVWDMFSRVMKILFMVLVAIAVLNTRKHVNQLVWVLVGSLGFYGLKGGLFTIMTGGHYRVWGPPGSFIEGNNEVALALIIAIPLMRYLQLISRQRQIRWSLGALMGLTALAALGSQSRGALLAIVGMGVVMWFRSQHKLVAGIVIVALSAGLIAFMPGTWDDRMQTIDVSNLDSSAEGRINAWAMAWNLAKDRPIVGGGFEVITPELFARYAPNPDDVHAAHSIYFEVLGEHGFPGLLLFLLLWWLVWRRAGLMRREGTHDPGRAWASHLGSMIQVSLIGYLVGGAFLSLAYFDLPYDLLVLVVVARKALSDKPSAGTLPGATPAARDNPISAIAEDRSYA